MTPEEIEEEYWANHYFDKPVTDTVIDDSFDSDEIEKMMETGEWESLIDVK